MEVKNFFCFSFYIHVTPPPFSNSPLPPLKSIAVGNALKLNMYVPTRTSTLYIIHIGPRSFDRKRYIWCSLIHVLRTGNNHRQTYVDLWQGTPFSLVAERNLREGGLARRVKQRLCITILLFWWIWGYSCCLMERGISGRAVLYKPCHLGVSFFEGYVCGGGGDIC